MRSVRCADESPFGQAGDHLDAVVCLVGHKHVLKHKLEPSMIMPGCPVEMGGVQEARQDVFDYIEMFYKPKRKHARNGMLSPVEFERQQKLRHEGV